MIQQAMPSKLKQTVIVKNSNTGTNGANQRYSVCWRSASLEK